MPVQGGQPNQFGQTHLNLWSMLRSLIYNGLGFAPITSVPVDGTSGTYAKFAGPGFMLFNASSGIIYSNRSLTAGSPTWVPINVPVFGLGGRGMLGNAKMSYSFATDGGAQATITPTNSPEMPAGAIILGGTIDVTEAFVGVSATIGWGLGAGAQVAALKAGSTVVGTYTLNTQVAIIPLFTAATFVKVAAATRLTMTIAGAALTAGKADINVAYIHGN